MIFSLSSNYGKKLKTAYNKSMKDLSAFFGFTWSQNRPKIFLVENRKTINELRGLKTQAWSVGWINKKDVFVLNKKNYERDSCHKYTDKDYEMIIKHELAHCFFYVLSGGKTEPDWLWEGVAIYASGQINKKKLSQKLNSFIDIYSGKKKNLQVYKEAGFAVGILIKKFGKRKLLTLIRKLSDINSKKDFKELFKKVYSKNLEYSLFI